MTRTTIKPVPGYGDALSDYNQVPVLTLGDRVRRDIILPVLDRRSDSGLVRSQAQFMRSSNGSPLVDRLPEKLSFSESLVDEVIIAGTSEFHRFVLNSVWVGVVVTVMEGDITKLTLTGLIDDSVIELTVLDSVFWFPSIQYGFMFKANGTPPNTCIFSMFQLI